MRRSNSKIARGFWETLGTLGLAAFLTLPMAGCEVDSSGLGGGAGSDGGLQRGSTTPDGGVVVPGTGGTGGSGGQPMTGGAAGSGGAPARTTPACVKHIEDYADELSKARQCTINLLDGKTACSTLVPAALAGCGSTCTTYVDDAKKLDQLREKWVKDGCVEPPCASPIACNPPRGGVCTLLINTCVDVH